MLRKTGCRDLVVSPDSTIQTLSKAVRDEVEGVSLHTIPTFADLYPSGGAESAETVDDLPDNYDEDELALILHSSGMLLSVYQLLPRAYVLQGLRTIRSLFGGRTSA